jgi:uncharacterized membrane protein YhaH (DUF805 family)
VVNGTAAGDGGIDVGIIAAGIAVPLALIALAGCVAAAALMLWRRRDSGTPGADALSVGAPSLNVMTISPLYENRTVTHRNELYAGDDASDMFGPPAPGGFDRDEAFIAHTMTWDAV